MSLTVYGALVAYMWAGGPDVPDATYRWSAVPVSVPGYAIGAPWPADYASRAHCEVNLALMAPAVGSYWACLPTLRP